MIPSTTNKLLVSEDWKKIYQSFRNADFKSYDFETLRRTMISYLRENYPEDFNDYIDSSEYLALIDIIAYLGQNLSFRIDLNARENFLETADRRDSILRLAKLVNYNAKRNVPASGFLKINSISTTDNVFDANGVNLSNTLVTWNDPTNTNWYQQFISVLNSAMPGSFLYGRPYDQAVINGIDHQQYRINSSNTDIPLYSFTPSINGTSMNFEIVSSLFANSTYVYEEAPKPGTHFSFIYKNDNGGNGSSNTGFFMHFRQGTLAAANFTIDAPVPNDIIGINAPDINNSDVWLWQLTASGVYNTLWTKVSDLVGNNTIYNSISNSIRSVYTVSTKENDQIDLNFSDGSFGDLPKGQFVLFYRQSNGLNYTIKPEQLSNVTVSIPYYNKTGQSAVLNITLGLQETVSNSVPSESNDSIKLKAPQNYYLQNRMITAEDYNIAPLVAGSDILKIKSLNRISSGVSKYYELSDVSGQYSHTNIFGNDGMLYRKYQENNFEFNFVNQNEILGVVRNQLAPIVASNEMRNFYLAQYPRISTTDTIYSWNQVQKISNQTNGYFTTPTGKTAVGQYVASSLKYMSAGTLVKFVPPAGQYFLPNNTLTSIIDSSSKEYIWAKVVSVANDGQTLLSDGSGPIILSNNLPTNAVAQELIPKFATVLSAGIESAIVNICLARRNFGLSFDEPTRQWYVVSDSNLDLVNAFSLSFQKDSTNLNKDSSWVVAFEWTGRNYKVRYRVLNYIFESERETAFFVDQTKKNYDFINDTVVKDQINILAVNSAPAKQSAVSTQAIASPTIITQPTFTGTNMISYLAPLQIWFTSTWLATTAVSGNNYVAVHPGIPGGVSTVTSVGAKTVTIASTGSIARGDLITFIPQTINFISTFTFTANQINQVFSLGKDHAWQVDSAVIEPDGYINSNKVLVSFIDADDNGQLDDPDSFDKVVQPDLLSDQTNYKYNFLYFKFLADGQRYKPVSETILAYPTESDIDDAEKIDGQLYYFYSPDLNIIKQYNASTTEFIYMPEYFAYAGRRFMKFHYIHNSGQDKRLDPSKTNLIDVYLLTKQYDTEYRNWLATRTGDEPTPPTSQSLEESFAGVLDPIKSISDEIIFQPTRYKVLFGDIAESPLQATFKAVRNASMANSDNDLKTRILLAIENFFSIENWNFGQTFYFSELSTYVMNSLTPDITNFVIVPKSVGGFGSLYEVTCQSNEIFVNGCTVNDIEIIDAITSSVLKTNLSVVVSTTGGY